MNGKFKLLICFGIALLWIAAQKYGYHWMNVPIAVCFGATVTKLYFNNFKAMAPSLPKSLIGSAVIISLSILLMRYEYWAGITGLVLTGGMLLWTLQIHVDAFLTPVSSLTANSDTKGR
jgi:hypothetical protein